ncbi:MAG: sarcosine oxidase subunit gamma [Rhodobacterales bacterium]|nr:sarcosine oxidase subunit gamma [Rhodobacterales bacterium]NCT13368.1 sarcosine oxidase subunit gamma [Rhodobacterales bacterium]
MASLIAVAAGGGLLPVTVGGVTLREAVADPVTSIAPFHGQDNAVAAVLKSALGLGFPAPNRALAKGGVRIVWAGQGRALLIGAPVPQGLAGLAALTDQADGMVVVSLAGAAAEAVLARLVPIDLRAATFKAGHVARTLLGHMQVGIARSDAQAFEVMAMRSMARTLVHELTEVAQRVAARGQP